MHVSEKVAAFSIVMVFMVVFLQPWKTFICKGGGGRGGGKGEREYKLPAGIVGKGSNLMRRS